MTDGQAMAMALLQNAEAHWLVRLERHASLLEARNAPEAAEAARGLQGLTRAHPPRAERPHRPRLESCRIAPLAGAVRMTRPA